MSEVNENVNPEEKVTPDEVAEPATPVVPDNSERSRLGRKVAHMEESMTDFMNEMRDAMQSKTADTPVSEDPLDLGDTDELVTSASLKKQLADFYKAQKAQEIADAKAYKKDYTSSILELSKDLPEEEFNSVINSLDNSGNPRSSEDPRVAAQVNFLKARNAVLEKKIKEPVNPIQGNVIHAPAGIGGAAAVKPAEESLPEFTQEELDFIKRSGLTDEQVKEALSNKSDTLIMK